MPAVSPEFVAGGLDAEKSVDVAVAEPVPSVFHREHVGMVDIAVGDRAGDDPVAEHATPAGEGQAADKDQCSRRRATDGWPRSTPA